MHISLQLSVFGSKFSHQRPNLSSTRNGEDRICVKSGEFIVFPTRGQNRETDSSLELLYSSGTERNVIGQDLRVTSRFEGRI